MIKTTTNFLGFIFLISTAFMNAQGGEKSFDENTHIVNIGVGLGRTYYTNSALFGSAVYRNTPAFSASYEQAFKKKLGPGYMGVGAYLGFQHSSYRSDYTYYYYENSWNFIMAAARAAYHWDVLNFKKADIYAGVLIGLRIQTYSYSSNDPDPVAAAYYRRNDGSVYPTFSVFAGARYYFVPKFGVFAEAGYGISYITGGISLKF